MLDIKDILRANPKAARDIDTVKDVIETMRKFREAGIVSSDTPTVGRRPSLEGLKLKGPSRQIFKAHGHSR